MNWQQFTFTDTSFITFATNGLILFSFKCPFDELTHLICTYLYSCHHKKLSCGCAFDSKYYVQLCDRCEIYLNSRETYQMHAVIIRTFDNVIMFCRMYFQWEGHSRRIVLKFTRIELFANRNVCEPHKNLRKQHKNIRRSHKNVRKTHSKMYAMCCIQLKLLCYQLI